jgi:hypothetical protein
VTIDGYCQKCEYNNRNLITGEREREREGGRKGGRKGEQMSAEELKTMKWIRKTEYVTPKSY